MWRRRLVLAATVLGMMVIAAGVGWPAWAQSPEESVDELAELPADEKRVAVATPPGPIARGAARSHAPWPVGMTTPEPKSRVSSATEEDTPADFVLEVVELVNEERARVGCAALALDPTLGEVAYAHSKDMGDNDFFSHTNLSGENPGDRITAGGYDWQAYAENIAAGYTSPEAAVNGWLNSPGHLENIQNCSVCETGVGYYFNEGSTYGHYWTQVFGRPFDRACRAATGPVVTPVPPVTPVTPEPPASTEKQSVYAPIVLHARPVNLSVLVRNGDFEAGPNGDWHEESTQFGNDAGVLIMQNLPNSITPYSGAYVAWLGGAHDEISTLYQPIELPQRDRLHLRFAMFVASSEQECGYDRGLVYWDYAGGRADVTLLEIDLCGGMPYPDWEVVDIVLEEHGVPAGAQGSLSFVVETDGSLTSSLFIDNVSIYVPGN